MFDQNRSVGTVGVIVIGIIFVFAIILLVSAVLIFWPPDCVNGSCPNNTANFIGMQLTLSRAENLLLIVAASGGVGALIHAGSSLADYVGNRQLVWSWVWWLAFRIPIGMALALVFYLLIRGGLIIPNGSTEPQINPYGIAGLAALVGMFAKQATDKLAEIFDTLFRSDRNKTRSEPLMPARSAGPSQTGSIAGVRELSILDGGTRREQESVGSATT